jgi:hypothetical protein
MNIAGKQPEETGHWFCLEGPSGKGAYRLSARPKDEAFGLGWQMKNDGWKIVADEESGRFLLRWEEDPRVSSWLAVREDHGDAEGEEGGNKREEGWAVWLVAPNAANMEDFETYRLIDIEAVEVDGEGTDVVRDEEEGGDGE